MMEYIYVKLRNDSKFDNREKVEKNKSNEINIKGREQILNKFLIKFLKNKFKMKEGETEKYIEKFYEEDIKIHLLCQLITKGLIENKGEYYESIRQLIQGIKDEIINKTIEKKRLEEFLKNDEETIKNRLGLINFIFQKFEPNEKYEELKTDLEKIDLVMNIIKETKDNIQLYFKDSQKNFIIKLKSIIDDSQKQKISEFDEEGDKNDPNNPFEKCKSFKDDVDYIKRVKDFLLFNIIYDSSSGTEEQKFKTAKNELEKIKNLIKSDINELYKEKKEILENIISKLRKNEKEDKVFIEKIKNFYEITDEDLPYS